MTRHVLFVDDSVLDRELATWALRRLPSPPGPVEVICAATWEEARVVLAERDVDVLLLDYNLPGRTGLDIMRSEPMPVGARIIMVTGHEDIPTAVATMREGAFDYVPKGLDWSTTLQRVVTRALEVS